MRGIVHIVGARPNFMKAAPVVQASQAAGDDPVLIHTGQHYDAAMSEVFFEQLDLPRPKRNLGVGSGSHAAQTAALMVALEEMMMEAPPPAIVVYGDINSTLAATLVASKIGVPAAHVEAGLRSFDRTMPEEINRIVTDALCDLHFTTSPEAVGHLAQEGVSLERIHFVGNPMIDTLYKFRDTLDPVEARTRHGLGERFGVVTLHRPSNVDHRETAARIVDGLNRVADLIPLVVPLHPRGEQMLRSVGLGSHASVRILPPQGYLDFMALMAGSSLVLTDSGGIQEEATILGVPCITIRDNTERPITVSMGTNDLAGTDPDLIVSLASKKLTKPSSATQPPLWDGLAGKRIASVLHEWLG